MNENQVTRRPSKLAAIHPDTSAALSDASSTAVVAFSSAAGGGNVSAALDVAASIEDLKGLFDKPEIKQRIVALQDTPLGFRTDKDPRQTNKKTGQKNEPYFWEVVRDCAIEATLRGLQLVGNQFNIISYRTYVTKEGFEFLIKRLKNVTDFRPVVGVPKTLSGGALIECEATWNIGNHPQSLKVVIPVKSDDYSGADQLIGKATRKFLKRCYEMMSGVPTPEGDAGDSGPAIPDAPTFKRLEKPVEAPVAPSVNYRKFISQAMFADGITDVDILQSLLKLGKGEHASLETLPVEIQEYIFDHWAEVVDTVKGVK
jgi:hypothetical protein